MLDKNDWMWLSASTQGAIALPQAVTGALSEDEALGLQYDQKLARQASAERALKDSMVEAALRRLADIKEGLREDSQMDVTVKGKLGNKTRKTRDEDGRQERALDTVADGGKIVSVDDKPTLSKPIARAPDKPGTDTTGNYRVKDASTVSSKLTRTTEFMSKVLGESDKLLAITTTRWEIDTKAKCLVPRVQKLFDEAEVTKELWTPMTREKIIGDNFIPDRFSATQQMLDGSNDYYIDECKKKGKSIGIGLAAVAQSTVDLASNVTTTVLGALGPVSTASALGVIPGQVTQQGMAGGQPLSREQVAMGTQITVGVTALLNTGIKGFDMAGDAMEAGTPSLSNFRTVMNGIGLGIGRIVAGATGSDGLGLAITSGIAAGMGAVDIGGQVAGWVKSGMKGDFDWKRLTTDLGAAMVRAIGDVSVATLSTASAETSGSKSIDLADAATAAGKAFDVAASAMEKKALVLIRNGEWGQVMLLLTAAGEKAVETLPGTLQYNAQYTNTSDDTTKGLADLIAVSGKQAAVEAGVGVAGKGLVDGTELLAKGASEKVSGVLGRFGKSGPDLRTGHAKRQEALDEKFAAKQKAMEEEVVDDEVDRLGKEKAEEKAAYVASLSCLGSPNPSDADFKTIAKLIAQVEQDRAIWAAITAIAAGGGSVAALFVPALGAVTETAKFVANIKAAADRFAAYLQWDDARKDAKSAVSPYATSFKNMVQNQREQCAHYSLQAAANAIKAVLSVGELSPYAPAFKIAVGSVGAMASAEAIIYKVYNQVALVRAWRTTKKALDDPKNRRLGLIAREMNPTLAKYTIAYGAMIAKDEVAIRAMARIGLDRETLTRAGDGVADVKDFMQKLYVDDNVVLGILDGKQGKSKVPPAALNPGAWGLTISVLGREQGVVTKSPPEILGSLKLVAGFAETSLEDLDPVKVSMYEKALERLIGGFENYAPKDKDGNTVAVAAQVASAYADLAAARLETVRLAESALANPPLTGP